MHDPHAQHLKTIRIQSGDYVTVTGTPNTGNPNDLDLWRVTKGEGGWSAFKYTHPKHGLETYIPDEFIDWDRWDYWDGPFATKRSALESIR